MMVPQPLSNTVGNASRTFPLTRRARNSGKPHLILVDDDEDYREIAAAELTDQGFDVMTFDDGPPLVRHFAGGSSADVLLLDWNLPSVKGIDLLPRLRGQGINIPILMLTGMSEAAHEIEALERGATEFVDKSRGVLVLAKRVHLLTASAKGAERPHVATVVEDSAESGPLVLRPDQCRAYWRGRDVNLTVTEFDIVRKLVDGAGEWVSYRSIYDCVHTSGFIAGNGEHGYRTNVRASIKRIRCKFRKVDPEFTHIENFVSFGYCWNAASSRA